MHDQPLFESLEGLRGTGKSTVAPLLAAARSAVLVPTVPALYQSLRRGVDARDNVEARMAFYLSALFTATDDIRAHLSAGTPVVVDSYFARCLANHRAFGACLGITLPSDLPEPVTYSLVCDEDERQRRLAARHKPTSRWDGLAEEVAEQIAHAYALFPMHRVDTTGRTPEQVVHAILDVTAQGGSGADPQPVGAHPHFPPVPRGPVGTRRGDSSACPTALRPMQPG